MEEYIVEASKLLEKARQLSKDERKVIAFFIENISVGDIRAVRELKRLGIDNPLQVMRKLSSIGLLEEGQDCFNLAKPLRMYCYRRGKAFLLQEISG